MTLIPDWANEVMIAKGIGFEREEVKSVIWGYFESQFSEFDCDQTQLETYFAHMVDQLVKNGDVDRARKHFLSNSYKSKSALPERQLKVFERQPLKQDAVSEFEEKWKNYINSNRNKF